MDSPSDKDRKPESHRIANLSPEQLSTLLAADLKGGRPPVRTESRQSSRRRVVWAALILLIGLIYVIVKFTTAPAKVIVLNTSGEDAASLVIVSGDQRLDIGGLANGEVRQVEMVSGKPLRIEYTFDQRRVWTDSEPLGAFNSLTVFIGTDKKLRVVREAPWSRSGEPPQLQSPSAPRRAR